jgi:2-desacetyl-2-hydroxyethyl bacteriochlorophyllide A dehydrogenase
LPVLQADWASRGSSAKKLAGTMKAAVLTGPRTVTIQDVSIPRPEPGQVRVRIEGCGVCASNITPWEGPEWMTFPTQPGGLGHEAWGRVDAVAPDVRSVKVGDRVATLFTNSFAQYDVGNADAVIKLPASLAQKPFPGEPLGCAMNILNRSDIKAGQRVAIIGIGFLGALLTRLIAQAGAEVVAVSRRQASLDLAREMGAAETIRMDDHHAIIRRVKGLTEGCFYDRVIEATGKQWPLDLAGELVREGGRLIVAGYHQDGPRQVNMQQWNWKGIDVINAHERDHLTNVRGVREAIAALVAGLLPLQRLYTHSYPLSDLGAAFEAARDHPEGFVKALVMMP